VKTYLNILEGRENVIHVQIKLKAKNWNFNFKQLADVFIFQIKKQESCSKTI